MVFQIFKPMSPILSAAIPLDSSFIYQIKWDGIRGIVHLHPSEFKIYSKNGADITEKYPELHSLQKYFKGKSAVLDGELVIFDDKNKPDFKKILSRHLLKTKGKINYSAKNIPIYYLIFDILHLDDKDLTSLDYLNRKKILEENFINNSMSVVVDDFSDGPSLFQLMEERNMEGIVAKKKNSPYTYGKHHKDWFKIKIKRKMLVVVGGIKIKNRAPASLAVGIFKSNGLYYVGHVSLGLRQKDLELISQHLDAMKSTTSPFINFDDDTDNQWVKPVLTCHVSYLEKSIHDHLRHPQIIGFSSERPENADGKEFIIRHGSTSI